MIGIAALCACEAVPETPPSVTLPAGADGTRAFLPLPDKVEGLNPSHVRLGSLLFDEPLLSADGTKKCTTCHPLREAAMDGKVHSRGVKGEIFWNTPSV